MVFSYNWIKEYIKGSLPKPEKLAELLTMHSFEVEEVHPVKSARGGALLSKAKQFNRVKKVAKDYVLNIDILPNRGPDCFSHIGIAREIAAITNSKFQVSSFKFQEDKKLKSQDFVEIKVEDKNDCSRYTARVITNVKVAPSPKWIQERLKVCGLRLVNNIVDIVNYVMLETGQPLHAFDFDKISGTQSKKIIVRRAKKAEKIITLDNEKYNLDKDTLIIANLKGPLAIAGIKGGKKAEIDKNTKTIVLESANFNSVLIHRTSRKIGLKTDASLRFEHKIDPNLTEIAINRTAYLIQKIAHPQSGYPKVASGLVDVYSKKVLPKKIKLDLEYVEKLLGVKIPRDKIIDILKKLEFKMQNAKFKILFVEVPTFRLDVSLQEDLIEEIGRIYGYDRIPDTFPTASLIPPKRNFNIFWEEETKDILKEAGFSESYNYSFIGENEPEIFGYKAREIIEVENPVSSSQKYLRQSLIPILLKNVRENFRFFDEIKIFELGKIFKKEQQAKNKKKILEKRMLAGVVAQKEKENPFFITKGVIDALFNKLGISDVWYDGYQPTPEQSKLTVWRIGKCAEIKSGSQEIGFLGEISSKILKALSIKGKVVLFDIDFEELTELCSGEHEYQPISQYPAAVRDLAVLVPIGMKVVDVLNKINTAGGPLVRDVDVFDIYEGEELPDGKKNLAFHIIYQAEDRTLQAREIDEIQNRIIRALESEPDWQVRR